MATDKKVTALAAAGAFTSTDRMYLVQGGVDVQSRPPAELLAASRNLYVRTDGDDANTGLANTAGAALLTIQAAVDLAASYDNRLYCVTINIADGNYPETVEIDNAGLAQIDAFGLKLAGNTGTPANVTVNGLTSEYSNIDVSGITWGTANVAIIGGSASFASSHLSSCTFTATAGAFVGIKTGNTVLGNIASAFVVDGANVTALNQITMSGTPVYSTAFVVVKGLGRMTFLTLPTGSATGVRGAASQNSLLMTAAAGATDLPGNSAVTTATGGLYTTY